MVDQMISYMAHKPMAEVVRTSEGRAAIGLPYKDETNAAIYLVCRLFTDAVFNQDIRAIMLIIDRIDGAVPRDIEMASYRTEFSDCLNEIMFMTNGDDLKVYPDDTVMMALCKALYSISVQDIYWDEEKRKPIKHPSEARKKERDAALRMVLERTGGRKTKVEKPPEDNVVEIAGWIQELSALPEKSTC